MAGKLIPARYIGHHAVNLVAAVGPFFNADGSRRQSLTVEHGDILLMPDREILGQTYYRYLDTDGQPQLEDLGVGKRIKAEHAHLSAEELLHLPQQAEYEHHAGRPDFTYVTEEELAQLKAAALAQQAEDAHAQQEVAPVEQSAPVEVPTSTVVRGG